jgi:choline dehydrogenase
MSTCYCSKRAGATIYQASWIRANGPRILAASVIGGFIGEPNAHLNGRSFSLNMGKVLGGGSSINAMMWARGHRDDWDFFASESGDAAWNYAAVLNLYRRVEDWHGEPDPKYRGTGGPVFIQPAPDPNPVAPAMVEGACSVGVPSFENQNGRMMEGDGGAAIADLNVRDGRRHSIFRAYTFPYMDRPSLTVLTQAFVTRVTISGKKATGVEILYEGRIHRISAGCEVVLSLGALHTPKMLISGSKQCPASGFAGAGQQPSILRPKDG